MAGEPNVAWPARDKRDFDSVSSVLCKTYFRHRQQQWHSIIIGGLSSEATHCLFSNLDWIILIFQLEHTTDSRKRLLSYDLMAFTNMFNIIIILLLLFHINKKYMTCSMKCADF